MSPRKKAYTISAKLTKEEMEAFLSFKGGRPMQEVVREAIIKLIGQKEEAPKEDSRKSSLMDVILKSA